MAFSFLLLPVEAIPVRRFHLYICSLFLLASFIVVVIFTPPIEGRMAVCSNKEVHAKVRAERACGALSHSEQYVFTANA